MVGTLNPIDSGSTTAQKLLPVIREFVLGDISYDSWHLILIAADILFAAQKHSKIPVSILYGIAL